MTILKENWTLLEKPSNIAVKDGFDSNKSAIITMEPFSKGFGITLGNTLRRVLLSHIAGFAVTSIKIDNVLHEYSAIEGVKEDVSDIIMNIKSLVVIRDRSSSCTIKLSTDKAGPVLAGSIDTGGAVEIINKDLVICTLSEGASINIQMTVESGSGYALANKRDDVPIGTIMIDAIFSPIKKVAYEIQNARIGQDTDYDRLIMTVDTDGSITPRDAIGVAAKILQDQLDVFVNFDVSTIADPELENSKDFKLDKNLFRRVDELELSVRSTNCLKNERIQYVGDLVIRSEQDMLQTSNFGKKSLNEIQLSLNELGGGLRLGMNIPSWPPIDVDELSAKLREEEF